MNCCNLCALTHVGKMSRFAHFARHKISAARRFQLFCTPGAKIFTDIHAARGPKAEVSRKRSDNSTEPNASVDRDKKGKMEKLAKDKKRTLKRL